MLQDPHAVASIRYELETGACDAGLQLHPWVTPPCGEVLSPRASFLRNLDTNQEEQKLLTLKTAFIACFGNEPLVCRAGGYGLSRDTPRLLEKHALTINTSIAPRTSFAADGGPDYMHHDHGLFWCGERDTLLKVPLCHGLVGWGGSWGVPLYSTRRCGL